MILPPEHEMVTRSRATVPNTVVPPVAVEVPTPKPPGTPAPVPVSTRTPDSSVITSRYGRISKPNPKYSNL